LPEFTPAFFPRPARYALAASLSPQNIAAFLSEAGMYSDPTQLRLKTVKLSFNELEANLIQAWVDYHGGEKAPFIRELVLEQARLDLGLDQAAVETPQLELLRAFSGTSR
jgi:hypothetical protein